MRVSAHCLIERDGRITQYVNFNQRAWHAGLSSFQGREKCNDFAIGIELEGSNEQSFTNEQYLALQQLTDLIMKVTLKLRKNELLGIVIFRQDVRSIQVNISIGNVILPA